MAFSTVKNQWFFPPKPTFVETDISSQTDRVFIVTGGTSGVGKALVEMLYPTGATIYITSRSKAKAEEVAKEITSARPIPANPGNVRALALDLNDLNSVKACASSFQQLESRLDVLWNNAGTGGLMVEPWARTKQDLEAMVGMHCVATLLFTELLLPQLRAAAAAPLSNRESSTRVIWTSSIAAEMETPADGVDFSVLDSGVASRAATYGVSKVGSWMLAVEQARRYGKADKIVFVAQNPGNIKGGSYGGMGKIGTAIIMSMLHPTKMGAYTELFAGLSPQVKLEDNGSYIVPWGRVRPDSESHRKDIIRALKRVDDGGLDYPAKLYEWCQEKLKPFR